MLTICRGAWKGYQGRVKEADSKSVRLELTCKCKTITIPRTEATGENEVPIEDNRGLENASRKKNYLFLFYLLLLV